MGMLDTSFTKDSIAKNSIRKSGRRRVRAGTYNCAYARVYKHLIILIAITLGRNNKHRGERAFRELLIYVQ